MRNGALRPPAGPDGRAPRRRPSAGAWLPCLALAAAIVAPLAGARGADVVIAVLAPEGAEAAERDWTPMIDRLGAAMPDVRFRLRYEELDGLRRAVAAAEIDFFVANSGLYVEMEAAHGASRIATLESPRAVAPDRALASAIVVLRDRSDLQRLSDLSGKRLMAVAAGAFGGWQLAWRELLRAGVDPERDLRELRFAGFPMQRIVRAVEDGAVDAGVVRTCLVEEMIATGELRPGAVRVLPALDAGASLCGRSTALYPDWPFAVLPHAPRPLAKRVATALLAMPPTPGGHGWSVPADYQPVRDVFRELKIGPYAYLREHSLGATLRRNWGWVAATALLLLGGLVHVARVRALVARRTRELRDALAARERAERDARSQREAMDHLARLSILGEMASMLAHELNQPLTAIGNYAEGMMRRLRAGRADPQPLLEASAEIAGQAERAAGIMERIRAFARKRAASHEPLDLCAALEAASTLWSMTAAHSPPIERRCPDEAWVRADRLQVEQVLLNLLKNAHDALQAVDRADRRIVVSVTRAGDLWRVAVSDNGPGVAEPQRARLFEPFFTTKPDGLGLGLAICRSAIETHGGRLWARPNEPPPGFTVGFDLPALRHEP